MRILHLNLKGEYFDAIASGNKIFEYRLKNEYWSKRLVNRTYDQIHIKRGYPKKGDASKLLIRPYLGFNVRTITHPHFGLSEKEVFAIKVN